VSFEVVYLKDIAEWHFGYRVHHFLWVVGHLVKLGWELFGVLVHEIVRLGVLFVGTGIGGNVHRLGIGTRNSCCIANIDCNPQVLVPGMKRCIVLVDFLEW
jgi:hypothetical protein